MPTECVVSGSDRVVLEQWVRSPTVPQEWGLRAKILLATADGEGVRAMARRPGERTRRFAHAAASGSTPPLQRG